MLDERVAIGLEPTTFRVLGVIFSTDLSSVTELNFSGKIEAIRSLLNVWSRRTLTSFGKIAVIKTLALAKLTYLFSNLTDPGEQFIEDLRNLFFSFL
jgi:hypothetical protein